jgi:hypothetical protein
MSISEDTRMWIKVLIRTANFFVSLLRKAESGKEI